MKVIRVDNYDDEGPRGTQRLVFAELPQSVAEIECAKLNDDPHRSPCDWYRVVAEDYKLFVFEP
jgi:hypothetical protein